MIERFITVKFTAPGWHRWPAAPESRAYLREQHRHLFHVAVSMEVDHNERQVEFHDLLDVVRPAFGEGDFGAASCETLASALIERLHGIYGRTRRISVHVSEDDECGATVFWVPTPDAY